IFRAGFVSAAARDSAARHLCRSDGAIVLHGELAYAYAAAGNLDLRLHCPTRAIEAAILGRRQGSTHLATIALAEAKALSRSPAEHFKGLAGFPAQALHPADARPAERDWYYFELLRDRKPLAPVELEFTTGPGSHVVVYRMKPFASTWQALAATRDGSPVAPVLSTYNMDVFASAGTSGSQ